MVTVDGSGIYSHNEFSALEGDRVIRKLLLKFQSLTQDKAYNSEGEGYHLIRWKGDEFLIVKSSHERGPDTANVQNLTQHIQRIIGDKSGLASFRIGKGGVELIPAEMHLSEDQIKQSDITEKKSKGVLVDRIHQLRRLHPELQFLLHTIKGLDESKQDTLIGIIEGSIYDPLLQPIATHLTEKTKTRVNVLNNIRDLQSHIETTQGVLTKIDIASTLKTLNSEPGFGNDAGDAFIQTIFQKMTEEIIERSPQFIDELNTMRRWGDYYVVSDKKGSEQMMQSINHFFTANPYVVVRAEQGDEGKKFTVSFTDDPNKERGEGKLILPLMAIIGTDVHINLRDTSQMNTGQRENFMYANAQMLGQCMKLLDDEIRDARPEALAIRFQRGFPEDMEFVTHKMLNPTDEKRGTPRLKSIFLASDEELEVLKDLHTSLFSGCASTAERVERIFKLKEAKRTIIDVINTLDMFSVEGKDWTDLTSHLISEKKKRALTPHEEIVLFSQLYFELIVRGYEKRMEAETNANNRLIQRNGVIIDLPPVRESQRSTPEELAHLA
jgi:GGDEF domain-containing protein